MIFVHNLPFDFEREDIEDLFADHGKVTDVYMFKKSDGGFKGMAVVTLKDEQDVDRAIKEVSGKRLDGRMITCREDRGVGYTHPDSNARKEDWGGGGDRRRDSRRRDSRGRGGRSRGGGRGRGGRGGDSRRRRDSRRR